MRKLYLLKTILLLCALVAGSSVWAETKTEGFETASAGTNYQSTVTVSSNNSDCGIGRTIYYGCVSTSSKITGSHSAALRLYTSSNYGYMNTTTPIDGLSNVTFNPNRSLGPISSGDVKVLSCSPESKECLPLIYGSHKT